MAFSESQVSLNLKRRHLTKASAMIARKFANRPEHQATNVCKFAEQASESVQRSNPASD
jgi:hypothetical protein